MSEKACPRCVDEGGMEDSPMHELREVAQGVLECPKHGLMTAEEVFIHTEMRAAAAAELR
jgi:hypothetical protein